MAAPSMNFFAAVGVTTPSVSPLPHQHSPPRGLPTCGKATAYNTNKT